MHSRKQVVFVLLGCFEIFVLLVGVPGVVRASSGTMVTEDIRTDTRWSKEFSPYILDQDITIQAGASLTIGPGVRVTGHGSRPGALVANGPIYIEGDPTDKVEFAASGGLIILDSTSTVSHAYFHDGSGIHGLHADISIASSSFVSINGTAIRADGGVVRGSAIQIRNSSTYGIVASTFAPPSKPSDMPVIDIHGSAFVGNVLGAVQNTYSDSVHLEANWWGTAAGPSRSGNNSIHGSVYHDPVLDHDPTDMMPPAALSCCSSVLFIPGLEGTRLYDTSKTLLWEPIGNANILRLELARSGSSTERIIAGGPIDFALGLVGIYGRFFAFMDSLVSDGVVREWKSFGYDWRDLPDVTVRKAQDKGTTTESLTSLVTELASRSQTGKVTVVAHSNGGLVAKYLIKTLADRGQADLIDTLISVAVPYLGAPEALAGLLHGDHQSIAGGLFATRTSMRDLGLNMPSVYGLLPSLTYFLKSLGPTVVFASTTTHALNDGTYPRSITTASDQRNFVTDTEGVRSIPLRGDVSAASIGNATLQSAADALHAVLDVFDWPMSIARWAIFGWNRDTTTAIEYHTRPGCDGFLGALWCRTTEYFHRLATSLLGDGTVPVQSAAYGSDRIVSVDLDALSRTEARDYSHANILESTSTQSVIRKIVSTPRGSSPDLATVADISRRVPLEAGEPLRLLVTAHGDVRVAVSDEQGSDVSTTHTVTTGSGEGTYTEVKLPYGYGHVYSVVVRGSGYGFFTLGVERVIPGQDEDRALYVTMPQSPIMVATTTIDTGRMDETEGPVTVTLPPLSVDVDGNGISDYSATPDGNGLPGNAVTKEEADRIAREQLVDVLMKTDTPAHRTDPERIEIMDELYPPGTNGPLHNPPAAPHEQKAPPVSGSASCPSP